MIQNVLLGCWLWINEVFRVAFCGGLTGYLYRLCETMIYFSVYVLSLGGAMVGRFQGAFRLFADRRLVTLFKVFIALWHSNCSVAWIQCGATFKRCSVFSFEVLTKNIYVPESISET
jgi:hypothetical protein